MNDIITIFFNSLWTKKKDLNKKEFYTFTHFNIFFGKKKMAQHNLTHPRDRLPQPAIDVLDIKPEVNF